jgi:hypothetical protein
MFVSVSLALVILGALTVMLGSSKSYQETTNPTKQITTLLFAISLILLAIFALIFSFKP